MSDHFCLGSCQLSFAPMITYPVFLNPLGVAMGDFNNDNQTDLVITSAGSNTFSLLLKHNNGSFQDPTYSFLFFFQSIRLNNICTINVFS